MSLRKHLFGSLALALTLAASSVLASPAQLTALLNAALADASVQPGFDALSPAQKAQVLTAELKTMMPGLSDQIGGLIEAAVGFSGASTGSLAQAIYDLAAGTGNTSCLDAAVNAAYAGLSSGSSDSQDLNGFLIPVDEEDDDPTAPGDFYEQFDNLVRDTVNNVVFRRGGSGS